MKLPSMNQILTGVIITVAGLWAYDQGKKLGIL
jgi:hypothetical protein